MAFLSVGSGGLGECRSMCMLRTEGSRYSIQLDAFTLAKHSQEHKVIRFWEFLKLTKVNYRMQGWR